MNDKKLMRFRESFRGYNKDDVNAYIEQINIRFNRCESELRAQIAELESSNGRIEFDTACDSASSELDALRSEIEALRSENALLTARINESNTATVLSDESTEKSKLYDSMSAQVGNIIIVANHNAEKILSDARIEADRIVADAHAKSDRICREAEEKMHFATTAAEIELKKVSDKTLGDFEALASEARVRFSQVTDCLKEKSRELLAAAEQKMKAAEKKVAEDCIENVTD